MKPLYVAAFSLAVLLPAALNAQSVISARSGLIHATEGVVFVNDQKVETRGTNFPEVKERSVLRTEEGRAEILLNPGVFLRLGENSSFRMITNRLTDTRVELLTGAAIVEADEIAKDTAITIVAKDAAVTLRKAGIYRFDFDPARLRVYSGEANVEIGGKVIEVSGGKMLAFEGESAAVVVKFDKEWSDPLNRWSRRRGEYIAMANASAAKSLHDRGYSRRSSMWYWNPYFGMMTFVPGVGTIRSPYGYQFWSPVTVVNLFYVPVMPRYGWDNGGFGGGIAMPRSAGGYSGTVAAAPSRGASPAAAASSGSTAASGAGSSSIGRGSAGGGGRQR
jgi:hypothetical protein